MWDGVQLLLGNDRTLPILSHQVLKWWSVLCYDSSQHSGHRRPPPPGSYCCASMCLATHAGRCPAPPSGRHTALCPHVPTRSTLTGADLELEEESTTHLSATARLQDTSSWPSSGTVRLPPSVDRAGLVGAATLAAGTPPAQALEGLATAPAECGRGREGEEHGPLSWSLLSLLSLLAGALLLLAVAAVVSLSVDGWLAERERFAGSAAEEESSDAALDKRVRGRDFGKTSRPPERRTWHTSVNARRNRHAREAELRRGGRNGGGGFHSHVFCAHRKPSVYLRTVSGSSMGITSFSRRFYRLLRLPRLLRQSTFVCAWWF